MAADLLAELVAQVAERAQGRDVFLVGVTGAVAVGKSTLARAIAEGLQAQGFAAQAVATDGFLRPNKDLEAAGLNARKGFPETFDVAAFHGFLDALSSGRTGRMPVYSHVSYDIVPGETRTVAGKGVVIVEGVNVLQTQEARDRFGLKLYVDAEPDHIKAWYLTRLDGIIANEPESLIARIPDATYRKTLIEAAWTGINLVNLRDHIAPTLAHADVVVRKAADHSLVELVAK
jgi:type I pantothenate kinase